MIASDVGTFDSILNLSDKDLDALERSGLLGSNVPTVEMTESASSYDRRFRMRHRAKNLARVGLRDGDEAKQREAIRLFLLARLPVVRAHPFAVADDLRLPRELVTEQMRGYVEAGWIDPRTGDANLIDVLGEATLDVWLT